MATDLTGLLPSATFPQVLHVDGGITASLKYVYDGDGTQTVFQISSAACSIDSLTVTTSFAVTGNITVTGTVDGRDLATDGTKLDTIETSATADQTGSEIKTAYELEADTNAFTDAEQTKLSGIETAADVTDATNVDAAGAVMNADASTASMSFVIDEDDLVSDSATKVPTQQSVKAYVDSQAAGVTPSSTDTFTNKTINTASNTITIVEADISDFGTYLTSESNDLSAAVTWANVPDGNITEGSVTQHQAALSITESQISDLNHIQEGTAVLSTGEAGGTKYLREDGDGTCSWQAVAGGGSGEATELAVAQGSHGLVIQDVVKFTGGAYSKAQADSAANAEVIGIVSAVADAGNFTLTMQGNVTGLSGLTANTTYFLDPSTAGALTATKPTTLGQIVKPILIATSTTAGIFNNMRGKDVSITNNTVGKVIALGMIL